VPNAGPPAFLYDDASYWDSTRRQDHNPFILQDDIHKFFVDNDLPSAFVIPGSEILIDKTISIICDEEKKNYIYNNLDKYVCEYREKRKPHFMNLKATSEELDGLIDKFRFLVQKIVSKSLVFKYKVNFPILIDLSFLGKWIIDFNSDADGCFRSYSGDYYNYCFKFDPNIVAILFREKHIDFEDYLLSMRFKCNRKMDEFNEFLFAIFKNFDVRRLMSSELRYLSSQQKVDDNETFLIEDKNGNQKEVKRYCPHQHVDLKECGYINDDNELVCPLHGWKFNLENGKCTNQTGDHNILAK
jgi:UDP-MurNAc hydroxylase